MTDDLSSSIEPILSRGFAGPFTPSTLPVGALTASVLLDVLSLIADDPEQAGSFSRRASELLASAMTGSLATIALELVDALRYPSLDTGPRSNKNFALKGAAIAVYLLDFAARKTGHERRSAADVAPLGLSLIGLALLNIAEKRS